MNPAQHRKAAELFDRLRDLSAAEREQTLLSECGSDEMVRQAVRKLLAADDELPPGFLSKPAMETAARWVEPAGAGEQLSTGTRLGQFLLVRVIGSGGMGIVYEALDERLQRSVAIKVLAHGAVEDPERLQRFQQEARAVSLLNHPNIVSLYDAAEESGHHYLVTELVAGKTLRAVIQEGPLEAKLLLEIGTQIASALEAAHDAGIVHRDIKPENVMVRPDGFVKVLDFGLAKLREPSSASNLPVTRPGQVAGTVHYLSPEQILGKRLGPRSDIFSLGVVLYELATGVRPFEGPTDGAIFDATTNRAPAPPSQHRPGLDPAIESLILRALEKDPDLRFQTAGDMRSTCRRIARDSAVIPGPPRRRSPMWTAAAAVAVAATLLAAVWWKLTPAAPAIPERFERLTGEPGEEMWPSAAQDGRFFVYAGAGSGNWDIYLQRRGGTTAVNLTKDSAADDTQPSVSPDGSRIAFRSERSGGGIFLMEATGENPRKLTNSGYHPAWSPDGGKIAFSKATFVNPSERGDPSPLFVYDIASGSQRQLTADDAVQPSWSPHGWRLAYWGRVARSGQRDIVTVAAGEDQAPPVPVTADAALDWNPVWSPAGDALYFLSDRGGAMNVWRVPVDERTGRTLGPPEPVTVPADNVRFLNLPAGGTGFLYGQVHQSGAVGVVDYDPATQRVTGAPRRILTGQTVTNISFSPDGKHIVSDAIGDHQEDLWIMNPDGTGRRRLTNDPYKDRVPSWSPRGDEIAFFSDRGGKYDTWLIRPDGSGLRRLTDSRYAMQMQVWNRDGSRILAARIGKGNLWLDPNASAPVSDGPTLPGLEDEGRVFFYTYPPSGDLLVGERSGGELILYDLATGKMERTGVEGHRATWIPGTRHVVFGRSSKAMLYDPALRRERELFSVEPNHINAFASPPGGKQIYFTEVVRDSDLWYAWLPAGAKVFRLF